TPMLLGDVVDAVIASDAAQLRTLFMALAVVVIAHAAATAWSRVAVARVGERLLAGLRADVVSHVLRLPSRRVEAAGRGEVVSRVTSDVAIVGETLSNVLPGSAASLLTIGATAVGLASIDWRLMVGAAVTVPIQLVALRLYIRVSPPLYRASRAAAGERTQRILEALDARETLAAAGASATARAHIDESAREAADLTRQAARVGARFWGRLNLAELAGLSAILVVSWLLVSAGTATVGQATAAALLFMRLFGPMGALVAGMDDLQRAAASLARIVGMLDEPGERSLPTGASRRHRDATVTVRDLSFAYGERLVLEGVSLAVARGTTVAVVGASGAGKTTLGALLSGDLDAPHGSLAFSPADAVVGLVTQEPWVFSGTVREDLRIARPDASDDDLRQALTDVGAWEWVDALPEGWDTVVGAGGHVLGDRERQHLALARMGLLDPDVLVLDEATSGDGRDAGALDAAAARLARGRTTIVIAHRLSQAVTADQVVVMDAGRVVERGRHEDLAHAQGPYSRLWAAWSA
ncbi:MAG: ABC transporter ATP-binding protein, partial [Demequina sp.]|uniref:ABC transporter ATP-binding protein n=1 Tax=Demequina sp. TaxID=2050685 RepID=UPI003A8C3119